MRIIDGFRKEWNDIWDSDLLEGIGEFIAFAVSVLLALVVPVVIFWLLVSIIVNLIV